MSGGEISGNTAKSNEIAEDGGVRIDEEAVFTMSGGTISGNSAEGSELSFGGGVSQSGGSDIGSTDDTLIAVPGK
jgi:hypothetical protein